GDDRIALVATHRVRVGGERIPAKRKERAANRGGVIPPRLRLRRCAAPRGAIRVLGRPGDTHFHTPVDQFIVRPSRTSRDRYRYPMSAYSHAGATAGSCSASTTSHPRYEWRRRISISAAKSIAPSPGTVNAPLM